MIFLSFHGASTLTTGDVTTNLIHSP